MEATRKSDEESSSSRYFAEDYAVLATERYACPDANNVHIDHPQDEYDVQWKHSAKAISLRRNIIAPAGAPISLGPTIYDLKLMLNR